MSYGIPEIPTDNLYKFMSITGLLGAAFCFFFPFWYNHKRFVETHEWAAQFQEYLVDRNTVMQKWAAHGIDVGSFLTNSQPAMTDKYSAVMSSMLSEVNRQFRTETNELEPDFLDRYSQMVEDFQRVNRRDGQLLSSLDLLQFESDFEWPRLFLACKIGLPSFGLLAAWGLWLWYFRVQRYQDAALKAALESET